ncbi:tRNA (adenosine(37)-N6)-threonylcarbamoyltransferase complex dimerization subunit type 1 TsaB [Paracoccus sediminicola]|uniref:tRNA (adenosine(37)-N6)-threonylcarbamoyltransferase complex dimerization subunit type 1 TsaB n=1 Tax=Paracoccus sediminicola TaxID=3017783 RepID=UPI0022F087CE|nr:tRNA (adenosine(37)-N6)-threonylcarbamoyltransferase complex dimerization subunit type 1 TsaB [Paracoccus sediminicola]WBU56021.1 tRNA (adenosine(37)-N6)-threonylcarbamoyltransferase complex dimerization subunit type 1 TsaB [Paracoccus sediminicola]
MPDDLTLGFDSSAAHCAAALLSGDALIAERHEEMSRGQAERLFPMINDLLESAGVAWTDLARIGVGIGPGNFTGIRIAVAAARGLALSLQIPAIGISATEALASGLPRPCRIVIPGRRGMIIWEDFGSSGAGPRQMPAETLPPGPPVLTPIRGIAHGTALLARARDNGEQPRPAPIYLRAADAAPARDAGPVMLP